MHGACKAQFTVSLASCQARIAWELVPLTLCTNCKETYCTQNVFSMLSTVTRPWLPRGPAANLPTGHCTLQTVLPSKQPHCQALETQSIVTCPCLLTHLQWQERCQVLKMLKERTHRRAKRKEDWEASPAAVIMFPSATQRACLIHCALSDCEVAHCQDILLLVACLPSNSPALANSAAKCLNFQR